MNCIITPSYIQNASKPWLSENIQFSLNNIKKLFISIFDLYKKLTKNIGIIYALPKGHKRLIKIDKLRDLKYS